MRFIPYQEGDVIDFLTKKKRLKKKYKKLKIKNPKNVPKRLGGGKRPSTAGLDWDNFL